MLKSGVLILTVFPFPNRSPRLPLDGAGLSGAGCGTGRGAGARITGDGAGTGTAWTTGMGRGAGTTTGTRTRPMVRLPEDCCPLLPLPATTELTVWETSGAIWETTWLTTSLEEERLEDDWVLEVVELEEAEAGRLEDPEMAELTVWLTRGWIWLTTLFTISEVREEEDCWLLLLEDPEEKLEPEPKLEDPELDPKLEDPELEPKLEDPELDPKDDPEEEPKLDPEEEPKLEDDPAENDDPDEDELEEEAGLSLMVTKFGFTSLVSVYPMAPAV